MLTTVQPLCAAEPPDPKVHPQHRQGHFWVLWKGQLRYHPQQLRVHIHHHHRQGPFLGHHMVHPAPPEVQTPFLRDPPPIGINGFNNLFWGSISSPFFGVFWDFRGIGGFTIPKNRNKCSGNQGILGHFSGG